jgi:hypothetical protein
VTPTQPMLSTSLAAKVIGEYALVKTIAAVTSDAFRVAISQSYLQALDVPFFLVKLVLG